ncbi:hypothetical protein GCM10009609_61840 [Pseudonocardia aurantiaca]|uniref:Uncharacterized protein n=1 Tax=Pseudonocardia aurantiaca TaxID=75290 RepID=A0ABW4FDL8_9PSEU
MSHPAADLREAAHWWTRLAEALADSGRRLGQLGEQIGRDWPDDRGREWAERTANVRAELGREAVVAAELGAEYARRSADAELSAPPTWSSVGRPGARLAGTEAKRADEERGMRIAELSEPPR